MPKNRLASPLRALGLTLVIAGSAAGQVPSTAEVEKGRQVFEQLKCRLCHSLDGKGGKLSTALDGVGLRRDAKALTWILTDPAKALADSKAKVKMPVFPFKEGEREALIAYLETLRSPK